MYFTNCLAKVLVWSRTEEVKGPTTTDNQTMTFINLDAISIIKLIVDNKFFEFYRPQTSRTSSRENQLKRLAIQPQILSAIPTTLSDELGTTNITIIQVSSPISSTKTSKEIFNFPTLNSTIEKADSNFRSNVQIIPSNYSPPPSITTSTNAILPIKGKTNITVQVSGSTSLATGYGKIIKQGLHRSESQPQSSVADISPSVRSFGVTNIPIGSDDKPSNSMHYEQVFITPSTSSEVSEDSRQLAASKMVVTKKQPKSSSQTELHVNRINLHKETVTNKENNAPSEELVAVASTSTAGTQTIVQSNNAGNSVATNHSKNSIPNSAKKQPVSSRENLPSPLPAIRKFLTRGLTEACISRQSRKDSSNVQRQPIKNVGQMLVVMFNGFTNVSLNRMKHIPKMPTTTHQKTNLMSKEEEAHPLRTLRVLEREPLTTM